MDLIGPFLSNCMLVTGDVKRAIPPRPNVEHIILRTKYGRHHQLLNFATENGGKKILVFTNATRTAEVLAGMLTLTMQQPAGVNHGQYPLELRHRALTEFNSGRLCALVCTTMGARRFDIHNVDIVFNYDLPKTIDEYLKRIGWTGRVGRGMAVSFYVPEKDSKLAADLVRVLREADQTVPDFLEGGGARVTVQQDQEFDEQDYIYPLSDN